MEIKIENFEGPLDLLLQLIEQEELDITQVSLSAVAEQFISYLETIEKKETASSAGRPEILADFLLIAAKLLYIKSRALLPELEMELEEDSIDLASQLKMYKKFVEASKLVAEKFLNDDFAYSRPLVGYQKLVKFEPAKTLSALKLKKVFEQIIKGLDGIVSLPKKSLERIISIKEKIKKIQSLLKQRDSFNFSELMSDINDKTEIIVSFLGLLELAKQKEIILEQIIFFGEIEVRKS